MHHMDSAPGAKTIIDGREVNYFCGTGYFGLQGNTKLINAACHAMQQYGIASGTSRSGFGNNAVLLDVEEKAARFFEAEQALYYVSGYLGNAILLQGLSADYEVIFADAEAHYSVMDGAAMAKKPVVRFAHCDVEDLQRKLTASLKPGQRPLVITDGVFPTSGAVAPLADYDNLLSTIEGAIICVDDAHATAVLGLKGQGSLEYCGVSGKRRYSSGTLSKAVGGHGGVIAGSSAFIEQLKKHSSIPYGTSSVPVPAAAASAAALQLLMTSRALRQQLWENVAYAKAAFRQIGFTDIPDTPVPIICLSPSAVDLGKLQQTLFDKGQVVLHVPGGSYTSVPKSGAIRVAIFSTHSKQQIDELVAEMLLGMESARCSAFAESK